MSGPQNWHINLLNDVIHTHFRTEKSIVHYYNKTSFLFQYNADVRVIDHEGRNSLWYAKSSGSQECVELLRNQGCTENPTLPRRRASSNQGPNGSGGSGSGGSGGASAAPGGSGASGGNEVFEKLPASVI